MKENGEYEPPRVHSFECGAYHAGTRLRARSWHSRLSSQLTVACEGILFSYAQKYLWSEREPWFWTFLFGLFSHIAILCRWWAIYRHWNRRNLCTRFNFVIFVLLAESTTFCSLRKPYTYTSVCNTAGVVRKLKAYEGPRMLEYKVFTCTKMFSITVSRSGNCTRAPSDPWPTWLQLSYTKRSWNRLRRNWMAACAAQSSDDHLEEKGEEDLVAIGLCQQVGLVVWLTGVFVSSVHVVLCQCAARICCLEMT